MSTFQNWGSSSRLVLRRNLPTLVIRGSFSFLKNAPWAWLTTVALRASAFVTIERNFQMRNRRPIQPQRIWLKRIGPGLSSRMAIATGMKSTPVRPEAKGGTADIDAALGTVSQQDGWVSGGR